MSDEVKHEVYMAEGTIILLVFVKQEFKTDNDYVAQVLREIDSGSDFCLHKSIKLIRSSGIQTE
jgi:hypothetical protein